MHSNVFIRLYVDKILNVTSLFSASERQSLLRFNNLTNSKEKDMISYGRIVRLSLKWSRSVVSDSVRPTVCVLSRVWLCATPKEGRLPGSSVLGNFPGKSPGVGRRFLLQGIFPTQGSNPGPAHCRQRLYLWAPREAHQLSLNKHSLFWVKLYIKIFFTSDTEYMPTF